MVKKMKRFAGGGLETEGSPITVTGTSGGMNPTYFDLGNMRYNKGPAYDDKSRSGSGFNRSNATPTTATTRPTTGPTVSFGGIDPKQIPLAVQPAGSGTFTPRAPGGYGLTFTKHFAKGGEMGDADMAQDKTLIKKAFRQHDAQEHKGGKGTKLKLAKGGKPKKMAKGGSVSSASKRADGCATKGKTKGRFV